MSTDMTPSRRRELADLIGCHEQYLYQCLKGLRDMDAEKAMAAETITSGELRRWDLCSKSWHRIWPDLIGTEGAPAVADHPTPTPPNTPTPLAPVAVREEPAPASAGPSQHSGDESHRRGADDNGDPFKVRNTAQADLLARAVGLQHRKSDKPSRTREGR